MRLENKFASYFSTPRDYTLVLLFRNLSLMTAKDNDISTLYFRELIDGIWFPIQNLIWEFKALNALFSFSSSLKCVEANNHPIIILIFTEVFDSCKYILVTQSLFMYIHLLLGAYT